MLCCLFGGGGARDPWGSPQGEGATAGPGILRLPVATRVVGLGPWSTKLAPNLHSVILVLERGWTAGPRNAEPVDRRPATRLASGPPARDTPSK